MGENSDTGLERLCLIGLECRVVKSAGAGLVGVHGIVVRDTLNTLVLEGKGGETRTVPKNACGFEFSRGGKPLGRIDGKDICSRPEERPKK